ncbi:MAG: 5-(carboxyamino)imidazole ribonucleotide mutase [Spirochaetia bacterium]|jgi:phosphoribosylaminoimidazole carboxylase PurE protein|nr:5-(carboxyamino)imidazole ribonucleotide mutase [Spirochaetales bacterium]MDX9783519.1 5-(carboxyamino)imidazole ribonucleotide mutase [Spirochaetia bacterium]
MKNRKVLILMGGKSDSNHAARIIDFLNKFGIPSETRIASAHKTPEKLMSILAEEKKKGEVGVFITIAGLSNALSGVVEFSTELPVVACPPPSEAFAGADIFSSLRMPPGVAVATVLDPRNAALFAAKILAIGTPEIGEKIRAFQKEARDKIETDDAGIGGELYTQDAGR